jgi:hypothetical protein
VEHRQEESLIVLPVGQGFFCKRKNWIGYNYIQNSQRGFHKEDDATYSNVIYKTKRKMQQTWNQMKMILKLQTPVKESVLGFNSSNDFHRRFYWVL